MNISALWSRNIFNYFSQNSGAFTSEFHQENIEKDLYWAITNPI